MTAKDPASLAMYGAPRTCVAIGTFDGLHSGHRTILRELVWYAGAAGLATAVLTFEPHPQQVLPGRSELGLRLSSPALKAKLIAQTGIHHLMTLPFTTELAALSPQAFVSEHLVPKLRPSAVFVGYNFRFGAQGAGTPAVLAELGREHGFSVRVFGPLTSPVGDDGGVDSSLAGQPVSSTAVRTALAQGKLGDATRLLGRPHRLTGVVVRGDGRGRSIGCPTANIEPDDGLLAPGVGVYAGWVYTGTSGVWPAVINSGLRPTFRAANSGQTIPRLEAHLIGFAEELYGCRLEVLFVARIRDEQRFASSEELCQQINRDVITARQLLRLSDRQ